MGLLRPELEIMGRTYRGDERQRRKRRRFPSFNCQHCRREIPADATGTAHRNHCPLCLWSVHVDERPGDRKAACGGGMEPIAIWVRNDHEWSIVHRCGSCKSVRVNRIAGDDSPVALMSLAARPIASPPFPVEGL